MNDKAKEWLFGSGLPDRETLDKLKAEVNLPSERMTYAKLSRSVRGLP